MSRIPPRTPASPRSVGRTGVAFSGPSRHPDTRVPLPSFFDWYRAQPGADARKPWLLLGKGPTFAGAASLDRSAWRTFGLNHVCRDLRVDVAHAIDLDVIDQCGPSLLTQAGILVMPWRPHVPDPHRPDWIPRKAHIVSPRTLQQIAETHPILRTLAHEGRLVWYNLSTATDAHPGAPVVRVRHFSAVAALNLLAMAGAETVRSLGIDGGADYAPAFADLAGVTRLAGGQRSFDLQFAEIARTLTTHPISYAPLHTATPIRIYVGATEAQDLPVRVLEHSIRRRTPMDVQVTPLYRTGIAIPEPRDAANRGRTPFSFQRFLIPEAAGFQGRAIYLDSDMLVFEDITPLWQQHFGGAELAGIRTEATDATARFSVLLLDCERLRWTIGDIVSGLDAQQFTYEQLLYQMNWGPRVEGLLDPRWNRLDTYHAGDTALLHYTDVHRQPWVSTEHPLGYLWMRELFEALENGFITEEEIDRAVKAGHVRPSLAWQVRERIEDPLLLPRAARRLDRLFVEPFRLRPWATTTRAARAGLVVRAAARRAWRQSALFRLRNWVGERL